MKPLTKEENAQADRLDREKADSMDFWKPWRGVGETAPEGRRLESDPMYQILEKAKDRYGR